MGTTNPANFNNPVAIANGGSNATSAGNAFDGLSPLAVKGDLIGYSSTNIGLAVGTNAYGLICDSTAVSGVSWTLPPSVTSVAITSANLTLTGSAVTTTGTYTVDLPASVVGNNMLLNPSMELYMRKANQNTATSGTIAASSTVYTLDRWQFSNGASTACTVKQIAGTTSGSWYAQVQRINAQTGTAAVRFAQSLTRDMCIGAAGNTVTLQFEGKCGADYSSASSLLTVTVYSGTGTSDISGINGAFTGSSAVISTTVALTTSFQAFTATSSTLGSTVTQLCVEFSFTPVGTASTNDWFGVTNVQLELGSIATSFEIKPNYQVYSECARFYLKSFNPTTAPASATSAFTDGIRWTASQAGALSEPSHTITFPITMRTAPTITTYNYVTASNSQVRNLTRSANLTSTSSVATAQGVVFTATGSAATAAADSLVLAWTADAEIT